MTRFIFMIIIFMSCFYMASSQSVTFRLKNIVKHDLLADSIMSVPVKDRSILDLNLTVNTNDTLYDLVSSTSGKVSFFIGLRMADTLKLYNPFRFSEYIVSQDSLKNVIVNINDINIPIEPSFVYLIEEMNSSQIILKTLFPLNETFNSPPLHYKRDYYDKDYIVTNKREYFDFVEYDTKINKLIVYRMFFVKTSNNTR